MSQLLFANPDKCTGCNRCTYICSARKTGEFAPQRANLHINNFPHHGFSVPSICFQCPGAPCLKACPEEAISRNGDDVVVVDALKCVACGSCAEACPYGMIEVDSDEVAGKCDYCGGDPACVKECFSAALTFEESTPELVKLKGAQMKQRSKEGTPRQKRDALGRALLATSRIVQTES